jgi:hypothetical protein
MTTKPTTCAVAVEGPEAEAVDPDSSGSNSFEELAATADVLSNDIRGISARLTVFRASIKKLQKRYQARERTSAKVIENGVRNHNMMVERCKQLEQLLAASTPTLPMEATEDAVVVKLVVTESAFDRVQRTVLTKDKMIRDAISRECGVCRKTTEKLYAGMGASTAVDVVALRILASRKHTIITNASETYAKCTLCRDWMKH